MLLTFLNFTYFPTYKLAVYENLSTGIVYGEGQETRRYSPNF
jgi:hypothetical protein